MGFRIQKIEARTLQNKVGEELEGCREMESSPGHFRKVSSVLLPIQRRSERGLSDLGWAVCMLFLTAPSGGTSAKKLM